MTKPAGWNMPTSPETEDRLAALLGDDDTCPHGHPIPDKNGNMPKEEIKPLSDFDAGQTVRICGP